MGTLAVSAKIPVEVYLNRAYSPDRDFVDGEVIRRNVGEMPHASVQKFLLMYFGSAEQQLHVRVYPEQRVQTSETHYRVADICGPRRCAVGGDRAHAAPAMHRSALAQRPDVARTGA